MGCNIPRPSKRPPTPPIYETDDQLFETRKNEVLKAFEQFHKAAHDLTYHDTDLDQTIKERRTNCPNCCATITGPICEYCGTRFFGLDMGNEPDQIVIPVYIGDKQIAEVVKDMKKNPCRGVDSPKLPIQEER